MHAIEYAWLDRMRTVDLFAYRLPADASTLTSLWPLWDATTACSLGFSGIRLRNAVPRA
jgi:hypothetical protein